MNNKEYSAPVITIERFDETDVLTSSKGTESSKSDIQLSEWEW